MGYILLMEHLRSLIQDAAALNLAYEIVHAGLKDPVVIGQVSHHIRCIKLVTRIIDGDFNWFACAESLLDDTHHADLNASAASKKSPDEALKLLATILLELCTDPSASNYRQS